MRGNIILTSTLKALLPPNSDKAQLITEDDLARMRTNAISDHFKEDQVRERKREHVAARNKAAATRADKIEAIETQRKANKAPSSEEKQMTARRNELNSQFTAAKLQQEGIVRQIDSLAMQAKVYTVRDRQIAAAERKIIEEKMEALDEKERVERVLKEIEDEKKRLRDKEAQEKESLRIHMENDMLIRQQNALLEKEAELREAEQLAAYIKAEEAKSKAIQEAKEANERRLRREADAINAETMRLKEREKMLEREEDLRLAAMLRQKEIEERKKEEERIVEERRKNIEFAALQQQQAKKDNKMAEIEEARLRATLEKKERAREARLREEQEKQIRFQREQKEALDLRLAVKAEEARREREEYLADLERNKRCYEELQKEKEREKLRQKLIAEETKRQLDEHLALKEKLTGKEAVSAENERIRGELEARKNMFDDYRWKKIEELKSMGVEDKYLTPLYNFKIEEH